MKLSQKKETNKNETLISVLVVTYNAESTIISALNSIYNQTYKNIELIITDDRSTDDTCNLCKKWIKLKGERFTNTVLLESNENTGVTKNINRGFKRCKGEWVKELAGDDLLPYDSIEKNLQYINENNISTICCSKSASFVETVSGKINFLEIKPDYYTEHIFNLDSKEQYKKMLYEYVVLIPTTAFINTEMLKKFDYFDESFPEIDDHPFFLKISSHGIKIHYNPDLISYFHRTGINSISQTKEGMMNIEAFKINGKLHRQDKRFVLPNIPKYHLLFFYHFYLDLFRRYLLVTVFNNKKNTATILLNKLLLAIDPYPLKKKLFNIIIRFTKKDNRASLISTLEKNYMEAKDVYDHSRS